MSTHSTNEGPSPQSFSVRSPFSIIDWPSSNIHSLDALAERLAKLEKTGQDDTGVSSPVSLNANQEVIPSLPSPPKTSQYDPVKATLKRKYPSTTNSISSSTSPSDPPGPKRRSSIGTGSGFRNERHSPSNTHQATEAKEYLDHELQFNPALSQDRRSQLETARKFVGKLSNPDFSRHAPPQEEFETEENLPRPTLTPELLYMMLPGECPRFPVLSFANLSGHDGVTNTQRLWIWPDHISPKTLERMGLAIIENSESKQILLYYRVVVSTKVITFLMGLILATPSEPLKEHFKYLQRQYRSAAFQDLSLISVSATPSLVLLQALLSGVSSGRLSSSFLY